MKKEGKELALMVTIVCLAIIGIVVVMTSLARADTQDIELPEPEYTTPAEIILLRAEAPERANTGLATYETFGEALERAKAAVPDELEELAGRLIWGEGGGVQDDANRYATLWTAINRVEAWGGTLYERMTEESQFHGLDMTGEVPEQYIREARLIIALWEMEREGWTIPDNRFPAGLPERFLYFEGDGTVNHFSTDFGGGEYWDDVESRWGNG